MPFGSYSVLADIIHLVSLNNPSSILDLGVGNGLNGCAFRNYCGSGVRLVGVEGFQKYQNTMWECYNSLVIDTIESYLEKSQEEFEVIVMTDVIEHFTKEDGRKVIEKIKKKLKPKGALFISTPSVWIEQGAAHGNELETHRSLWNEQDFTDLGFTIVRHGSPCRFGHMMIIGEYLNR